MASNEKLLNTKVVQNFEIFNFCFRHFFIWTKVWMIKFKLGCIWKCPIQSKIKDFSLNFVLKLEFLPKWKLQRKKISTTLMLGKSWFRARIREKNKIERTLIEVTLRTQLALMTMISLDYRLSTMLASKLTPGCYSLPPLKESRPEIHTRKWPIRRKDVR